MRRWTVRLAFVAVGMGAAVLALEVFVRFFLPQPLSAVKRHPILGWLDKPGARYVHTRQEFSIPIQINSQGFRDDEYSLQKSPGVFRIAVVGDSFPEGQQVLLEQTFPKIMEADLRRKNPKIEVLNCGISGFGVDQYLLLIQEKILAYSPDLVVVLFTPNDMDDMLRKDIAWLENGRLRLRQVSELSFKTRLASELKSFMRQHSMLWILFTDRLGDFKLGGKFLDWSWRAVGDPRTRRKEEGLPGSVKRYLKKTPPETREGWRLVEAVLSEIRKTLSQRKVPMLLVLGTVPIEMDQKRFEKMLLENGVPPEKGDREKTHRLLWEMARRLRIPCMDLLPALRRLLLNGRDPHWKIDGHWTPAGHEVAAREILMELQRAKFLPPKP